MNYGNFHVDIDGQVLFTDSAIISAIRSNETLAFQFGCANEDGGFMIDIPAMTIGGGARDLPLNETVKVALQAMAHRDPELGYSMSISMFPYLPPSAYAS